MIVELNKIKPRQRWLIISNLVSIKLIAEIIDVPSRERDRNVYVKLVSTTSPGLYTLDKQYYFTFDSWDSYELLEGQDKPI